MSRVSVRMLKFWGPDFLTELRSNKKQLWVMLGFAAMAFLVSELMHYLLVPDLGRHGERMVAEGVSALIVGGLATQLLSSVLERRRITLARLQVIEEMNHHIRNALTAISLSADSIQNQQSVLIILEGVEKIQWALSEVLPRDRPLTARDDNSFFYFVRRHKHG